MVTQVGPLLNAVIKSQIFQNNLNRRALIGYQTGWEEEESESQRIIIFCDGSWSLSEQNGGCSAVAIQQDCVLECKAGYLNEFKSVLEAEINGIVMGMKIAKNLKCRSAVVSAPNPFGLFNVAMLNQ